MPRSILPAFSLVMLLGSLTPTSQAQNIVYAPSPAPIVIGQSGPVYVAPTPTYPVRQTRRVLRRSNQYTTYRPTYGSRAAITFAPYSDRYFPTADNTPSTTTSIAPRPTYYIYPR